MTPPRVLGSSFSEGSQEPVGLVRRLAMIAVWSGHRVRNFLPYNKRCEGRHDEKGRKKGPDSLAFVWPPGHWKKQDTNLQRTYSGNRQDIQDHLAAWSTCRLVLLS